MAVDAWPWGTEYLYKMAYSDTTDVRYFRRPWYWFVVLVLVATVATALVVANAEYRYSLDKRGFESGQELRAQRIEHHIDDYFSESIELATFGAKTLAAERGNLALTKRLTLGILESRHNPGVHGAGIFFAPYAFDGQTRLVSVYDHFGASGGLPIDQAMPGGITQVLVQTNAVRPFLNYPGNAWFRRAAQFRDQAVFFGPVSEEGLSYISTLRAVYDGRGLVGVFVVDTLTTQFKALLKSGLEPGDIAWIEGPRGGRMLLATAPIPRGARLDRRVSQRYTRAFLHLSTDAAPLQSAARDELSSAIGLLAGIWLVAALIAIGMVQRWMGQERQRSLEVEQDRLEDEIAFSRTVEVELRKAAYTDALTGLSNRTAFLEFAESILGSSSHDHYAVFFIDLDRFNIVNETLGHLAGDELLRTIGERLKSLIESTDLVARLGGDEFVVVASIESRSFAEAASLLLAHLSNPILISGRTVYPEASVGVVAIDATYSAPEDLLRDADIAMYAAKDRGRGQFAIFDAAMRRRVADESQLEDDLRRAIEHGELLTYYQPIVNLRTQQIVAFEALVRWQRRDGSIVNATEFMRFAEAYGFVQAIDAVVFRTVCGHAKAIFSSFPSAEISLNVSAAELTTPLLAEMMEPLMRQHGVSPTRLKLEITETAMMTSSETALKAIERLRALGLEFVLDDFGTGYSSLAYLQRLPIAGIKIDRSFVEPLLSDPKAVEIVRSIVALARSFGLSTTAEGVETREHLELLTSLGVDHAQGFFFSPALEISALIKLRQLQDERPSAAAD